jgi:hypothetical protein
MDAEYVRNGVAQIFLEVEPLTGKRHVEAAQHRTRKDWALWIKGMLRNDNRKLTTRDNRILTTP